MPSAAAGEPERPSPGQSAAAGAQELAPGYRALGEGGGREDQERGLGAEDLEQTGLIKITPSIQSAF